MSDIEDLKKISDLKEKGLITDEEFKQSKEALLSHSLPKANDLPADSPKSRTVYGLLGLFFGFFGAHNFYLGRASQGFLQILWLVWIVAGFLIPVGSDYRQPVFIFAAIFLVVYAAILPLWVSLNLLLTNRDGQGRLMDKDGKMLNVAFGSLILVLFLLLGIPFIYMMVNFGAGLVVLAAAGLTDTSIR